jgi:hypothetical protein
MKRVFEMLFATRWDLILPAALLSAFMGMFGFLAAGILVLLINWLMGAPLIGFDTRGEGMDAEIAYMLTGVGWGLVAGGVFVSYFYEERLNRDDAEDV